MSFHSVVPAPHTILNGVRKLPPATVRTVQPDGTFTDHVYWRPEHVRRPEFAGMSSADWRDAVLARCGWPSSAAWSPTSRSACCSPAASTRRWSWACSRRRASGAQDRSASVSTPPRRVGRRVRVLRPRRARVRTDHQQILVDPDRLLPAVDEAITAMAEPMVSHDCVAFYLLSQEVSKSVTVVQSGQGADEVFAGYSWYPRCRGAARAGPGGVREGLHRPPARRARHILEPDWLLDDDPSRAFIREHFAMPGARPRSTPRCGWTRRSCWSTTR
jgi:asparagine synthase (glutamine-hydrolysing)